MAILRQFLWFGGVTVEAMQSIGVVVLKWILYMALGVVGVLVLIVVISLMVRICARAVYDERFHHLRKMLASSFADPANTEFNNKEK
jgi:hypothetical protein